MQVGQMDTTFWNETTGEPRVWKLTSAVRRKAGGKGPSHRYLACCLSYYNLDEALPDHSTLSKIRLRYGLEVFRRFFEAIVEQCQQAKLVWGKELYFDSTQVNANADLDSLTPRFAVEARAAIREHLAALFAPEPAPLEKPETNHGDDLPPEPLPVDPTSSSPIPLPTTLSEAQHEE